MSSHALNIIRLPKGFRARSAAFTVMLLALAILMTGCRSSGPDPRAFNTPPNDAYALSGGKITHFTPMPGLPSSPADKAMLLACRQLPVKSSTARSAYIVVTAGQFGRVPLSALVVGKQVLMLPGDLVTMGIPSSGGNQRFILYPQSAQSIVLLFDSKHSIVGNTKVNLNSPVIATQQDLVITLPDLLTLFRERDHQRHQPPFIRNLQIIYDIRDYHR